MPVIPPVADSDDAFFWEGAKAGRLLLNRCAHCHAIVHPPVPMCGDCLSTEWETVEASGRGRVYTWIVSRHPSDSTAVPRIVALVALPEGVRVVSNLVDIEAADVHNEMEVEVTFVDYDTCTLPQFRPTDRAAHR